MCLSLWYYFQPQEFSYPKEKLLWSCTKVPITRRYITEITLLIWEPDRFNKFSSVSAFHKIHLAFKTEFYMFSLRKNLQQICHLVLPQHCIEPAAHGKILQRVTNLSCGTWEIFSFLALEAWRKDHTAISLLLKIQHLLDIWCNFFAFCSDVLDVGKKSLQKHYLL